MHGALFMSHQDVAHLVLREDGVVDRKHRAARIAEHMLDVLVGKRLDHHFGAGHFACHVISFIVLIIAHKNKKGPKRAMSGRPRDPLFRTARAPEPLLQKIILRNMVPT